MYAFNGNQWVGYDDTNSLFVKINYILQRGLAGGFLWSMDLDDFTGKYCGQGPYPLVSLVRRRLLGNPPLTTSARGWTPSREQPVWTTAPRRTEAPRRPVVTEAPWRPVATEAPWRPEVAETSPPPAVTPAPTWGRSTIWLPRTASPWTNKETPVAPEPTLSRPARGGRGATVKCGANGEYMADPNDCNSYFQCIHVGSAYERMLRFQCPKSLAFNPRLVTCDVPGNVPECGAG